MTPFLHIGGYALPTFGLMVALAMLLAYCVLRADLSRRGMSAQVDAETLVAIPCLAGIVGARLYHLLESPHDLFNRPLALLFSQFGFAWFGGFIAGAGTFLWLAWRQKVPLLLALDVGSPAAALGYGVGRIGCLLSGDGDYGVPTSLPWGMSFPNGLVPTLQRVHPTPIYEFIAASLTAWLLWRMGGSRAAFERAAGCHGSLSDLSQEPHVDNVPSRAKAYGQVFAAYLLASGITRFLVEFIRINPRSFYGLTNAQVGSLASVAAGLILWIVVAGRP